MNDVRASDAATMHRMLDAERETMRETLEGIALHRETDPDAATDPRCAEAAANLRRLAATIVDVPDDVLLDIARINQVTSGLLSTLITAKLFSIGFTVAPYADAAAFYRSITDLRDEAAARVMTCKRLN